MTPPLAFTFLCTSMENSPSKAASCTSSSGDSSAARSLSSMRLMSNPSKWGERYAKAS